MTSQENEARAALFASENTVREMEFFHQAVREYLEANKDVGRITAITPTVRNEEIFIAAQAVMCERAQTLLDAVEEVHQQLRLELRGKKRRMRLGNHIPPPVVGRWS